MKRLPVSRTTGLVVQESNNETLLYDMKYHRAFCLNETSSLVWRHCDGNTNVKHFISKYKLNEAMIELALEDFQKNDLLADKIETQVPEDRIERRKFMVKAGAIAAVALPIVSTIVAPQAVSAQSCIAPGNPAMLAPPATLPPGSNSSDCLVYCDAFSGPQCCSGNASDGASFDGGTLACSCFFANCN